MKKMMKQLMILIFIISFFQNMNVFADDKNVKDDEVVRTIDAINDLRAQYLLPLLSFNDALNTTATTHNRYMNFNNTYSSIEESGKLYYRGRYPWDRAIYNGYTNSYVFELLNKDITTFTDGLNQLLQNPYSRYGILDPLYSDLGMSSYNNYITYLFGGSKRVDNYEVIYPYNNQRNVESIFTNKYILDPYSKVSNKPESSGIPITYSIYSSEGKVIDFSDLNVSLFNTRTNEYVDIKVITSQEDRNLTNTIMILPLENYDFGTTYEVKIKTMIQMDKAVIFKGAQSSFRRYVNYSGTFTTKESAVSTTSFSYITRAKFVEDLMKASNFIIRNSLEIIFPDVDINSYNYKYIYTAYINNIIKGYGDGLYRPNANISRQDAYTILVRTYETNVGVIELSPTDRYLDFSDAGRIIPYAVEPLYKAKKIGLLIENQYEFNPGVYITTSEFNQILKRYASITK